MKKSALLLALPLVILLAWCWNKIDITDTNIEVESCNKYFELMDCILENDNDETYSEEDRNELRQSVKDMQSEWEWLDEDELDVQCTSQLAQFERISDRLDQIGCSLSN